jgi:hypothetical protein
VENDLSLLLLYRLPFPPPPPFSWLGTACGIASAEDARDEATLADNCYNCQMRFITLGITNSICFDVTADVSHA